MFSGRVCLEPFYVHLQMGKEIPLYIVLKDCCAWYNAPCYETGKGKVVPWDIVLFDVVNW